MEQDILPFWATWVHPLHSFFKSLCNDLWTIVATMTRLTVTEYLSHKWPRKCSLCRIHNWILYSFMIYHRVCNNSNTTIATMIWLTVTLVTNLVISHAWGKDQIVNTTKGTYPWSFVKLMWIRQREHIRGHLTDSCDYDKWNISVVICETDVNTTNKGNNKITELRTILQRESGTYPWSFVKLM